MTTTTDPTCLFCRIVAGQEPAEVVFADDLTVAFLDRSPLFKGHTLLVPREHHETLGTLPVPLVEPLFARAQRLARVMESELGAAGSFVAMNNRVSQSVPHLHIHVVPRNRKDGLKGFFWPRHRYTDADEMAAYGARLAAAYAGELT
jgi:histidine triad (HIT) family protein